MTKRKPYLAPEGDELDLTTEDGGGKIDLTKLPSRVAETPEDVDRIAPDIEDLPKDLELRRKQRTHARMVRWLKANPGRDPVTEAPRHIREAVGFPDEHKRETRGDGKTRAGIGHGQRRQKDRVVQTNHEFFEGKLPSGRRAKRGLREVTLHATKGYLVRCV